MSAQDELFALARSLRARVEDGDVAALPSAGRLPAAEPAARAAPSLAPAVAAAPAGSDREDRLRVLKETVSSCRRCPLGGARLNAVFGVGSPSARVMFVGEGPGFQEDHDGEPFVGKAGKLLDAILASIGLSRRSVYIANVVKCHPMINPADPEARGNDRPPAPEEIAACIPYLHEQIRLIAPRFVVTLGAVATRALLREDVGIARARGAWRELAVEGLERPVRLLPTYHPAALLRDPALKRDVWTDMKNLRTELEAAPV